MVNRERMVEQLLLHEGLREKAYQDTEGYWTVGVGYNMSGRGLDILEEVIGRSLGDDITKVQITKDEALKMLRVDIARIEKVLPVYFPEYVKLDEVRQRVALDMAFNMAFGALGFKKAIAAIKEKDWSRAARELYNSKWANQVGDGPGGKLDRCDRLSKMLLTGKDFTA